MEHFPNLGVGLRLGVIGPLLKQMLLTRGEVHCSTRVEEMGAQLQIAGRGVEKNAREAFELYS